MAWKFNDRQPVFQQILNRIRAEILRGIYPPGTQIPSVRQLAFDATVNPNTMQRALSELENQGLLISRGTVGRFVTDNPEILKKMKDETKRAAMEEALANLATLGIEPEELVSFIKEEKNGKQQ